jgi:phage gpG-like protein
MISFKIDSNLKLASKRFDKFFKKFPHIIKQGLAQASIQLKEIILHKTNKGYDVSGKRFPEYSKMYAEEKGKTIVNLQDTNTMLQSISNRVINKNKSQVYFKSQTEAKKAYWHQTGQGNLPVREFFGFNNKTERVIQKSFEKFLKKQIQQFKI